MNDKFEISTRVTTYDVGRLQTLKYSMILKLLQEAAGRQLDGIGIGYELLRESGVVFLLTRVSVEIKRLPAAGENITAATWFRGLRGAQFVRHLQVTDAHGGVLVESESLWITVNPDNHRIVRPSNFPFPEKMCPYTSEAVMVPERKLRLPDDTMESFCSNSRPVRWSDIDCNGHMNNAVYADLICDCCPGGLGSREFSYFSIVFQGEALEGAEIDIMSAEAAAGELYFAGSVAGKRCFEACAVLK